jgi:hypothetical protein
MEEPVPKKPLLERLKAAFWKEEKWYNNFRFASTSDAILFFFVVVLSFLYLHDTEQYREIAAEPCNYCPLIYQVGGPVPSTVNNITMPSFSFTPANTSTGGG